MAGIKEIDSSSISPRELNKKIRLFDKEYDKIVIKNPGAEHNLVAGFVGESDIVIEGSAGYFAGTMLDKAHLKINGNAGWFVGDNMTSGEIIVEGSAGDGAGQGIYGGTLVVKKGGTQVSATSGTTYKLTTGTTYTVGFTRPYCNSNGTSYSAHHVSTSGSAVANLGQPNNDTNTWKQFTFQPNGVDATVTITCDTWTSGH